MHQNIQTVINKARKEADKLKKEAEDVEGTEHLKETLEKFIKLLEELSGNSILT